MQRRAEALELGQPRTDHALGAGVQSLAEVLPRQADAQPAQVRVEAFGDEVKRRILVGTYALSAGYYDAYYRKAQKIRRLIAEDFRAAFAAVAVIASPASPSPAFRFGEKSADPITMYLEDIYTIAANLAGVPALSMPGGLIDGLPVGIQLIGNHLQEARLLNVAHRFQQATDWHLRQPAGIA